MNATKIDKKVWLIGGTSESVAISRALATNNISFVVSVVTATARSLYLEHTPVFVGCMELEEMQSFCKREKISAIVDASHPYAVEVSQNAIAISNRLDLPYMRYERPKCRTSNLESANSLIIELSSFELLLSGNYLRGHNVLLAIGCKALSQFKSWQTRATLYARVLPKIKSLNTALNAGFTSDRLIAIRPPLDTALEKALWQQWNISLVVTKASGKAGGEDIKRQLATELNIPLIIIQRPAITYPQQTTDIQKILAFCR